MSRSLATDQLMSTCSHETIFAMYIQKDIKESPMSKAWKFVKKCLVKVILPRRKQCEVEETAFATLDLDDIQVPRLDVNGGPMELETVLAHSEFDDIDVDMGSTSALKCKSECAVCTLRMEEALSALECKSDCALCALRQEEERMEILESHGVAENGIWSPWLEECKLCNPARKMLTGPTETPVLGGDRGWLVGPAASAPDRLGSAPVVERTMARTFLYIDTQETPRQPCRTVSGDYAKLAYWSDHVEEINRRDEMAAWNR